jgi:hypothetical protein
MTSQRDPRSFTGLTDTAIATMFDRRARRADGTDLRGSILSATLGLEQRRTWGARLRAIARPGRARVLILVLIAVMLAAAALVATGALRVDRALTSTTTEFVPRFEYVLPIETGLRPASGGPQRQIIAWIDGPDLHPFGDGDQPYGGQRPETGNRRGIVVAATRTPWSHSDAGRFFLRTAPAQLLADLQTTAGVPMGAITQTTLDGRPALTAELLPVAINDIHVSGSLAGISELTDFVTLYTPAHLTVAEIDGTTVFVLVWARTTEDLEAWLPIGNRFVASVHFVQEGEQP